MEMGIARGRLGMAVKVVEYETRRTEYIIGKAVGLFKIEVAVASETNKQTSKQEASKTKGQTNKQTTLRSCFPSCFRNRVLSFLKHNYTSKPENIRRAVSKLMGEKQTKVMLKILATIMVVSGLLTTSSYPAVYTAFVEPPRNGTFAHNALVSGTWAGDLFRIFNVGAFLASATSIFSAFLLTMIFLLLGGVSSGGVNEGLVLRNYAGGAVLLLYTAAIVGVFLSLAFSIMAIIFASLSFDSFVSGVIAILGVIFVLLAGLFLESSFEALHLKTALVDGDNADMNKGLRKVLDALLADMSKCIMELSSGLMESASVSKKEALVGNLKQLSATLLAITKLPKKITDVGPDHVETLLRLTRDMALLLAEVDIYGPARSCLAVAALLASNTPVDTHQRTLLRVAGELIGTCLVWVVTVAERKRTRTVETGEAGPSAARTVDVLADCLAVIEAFQSSPPMGMYEREAVWAGLSVAVKASCDLTVDVSLIMCAETKGLKEAAKMSIVKALIEYVRLGGYGRLDDFMPILNAIRIDQKEAGLGSLLKELVQARNAPSGKWKGLYEDKMFKELKKASPMFYELATRAESIEVFSQAPEVLELQQTTKLLGPGDLKYVIEASAKAAALQREEDFVRASAMYEEVFILVIKLGLAHPFVERTLENLFESYRVQENEERRATDALWALQYVRRAKPRGIEEGVGGTSEVAKANKADAPSFGQGGKVTGEARKSGLVQGEVSTLDIV